MYLYCFVVTVSVFTILVAGLYTREIVPFEQGILLVLIITSCFNLAFILFQPCLYLVSTLPLSCFNLAFILFQPCLYLVSTLPLSCFNLAFILFPLPFSYFPCFVVIISPVVLFCYFSPSVLFNSYLVLLYFSFVLFTLFSLCLLFCYERVPF